MTDFTEARAHYLCEAVQLLAISSPSASAFLGSARNKLLQDAEIQLSAKALEAHRREVCGACGNLMIPGWSCELKSKPRTRNSKVRKQKPKAGQNLDTSPCVVYHCLRCHRKTEQTLQSQPRRHMNTTKSLTIRQLNTFASFLRAS
jgi:RNase P subunit RPR2